jgi:cytochrome c oxidase cbb3-type subunit I
MNSDAAIQKNAFTFSDLLAVFFATAGFVAGVILALKSPEDEMQFHGAILASACAIFFKTLGKISISGTSSDGVIKAAVIATMLWGIVGLFIGEYVMLELAFPAMNLDLPWTNFGRLQPLHTLTVIFAFGGNALLAISFYAVQRTCQTKLYGRFAPWFVFIGYNAFVVIAGSAQVLGVGEAREYGTPVWYAGWWFMLVWAVYLFVFLGTIWRRKEPRIHAANWFFLVFILAVAIGYIVNNAAIPLSLLESKSDTIAWDMQTFMMQWARSFNVEDFFLTAVFLGCMYYLLPARAGRPIYSNKLAIAHCLVLCLAYIWIRPFLHYHIVLPDWVEDFGMPFSVVLWGLCVAGMLIGLTALRGAWMKPFTDPVMRFLVVSMVIKAVDMVLQYRGWMLGHAVNSLSHYTDWTVAHQHTGASGWGVLMAFGAVYCLVPWLWKRKGLYSTALVEWHFWLSALGILLYTAAMWIADRMQSLMLQAYDEAGQLQYSFVATVEAMRPYYIIRVIGGALFTLGALIMVYNLLMTVAAQSAEAENAHGHLPHNG